MLKFLFSFTNFVTSNAFISYVSLSVWLGKGRVSSHFSCSLVSPTLLILPTDPAKADMVGHGI